jgi:hypothetical protein
MILSKQSDALTPSDKIKALSIIEKWFNKKAT